MLPPLKIVTKWMNSQMLKKRNNRKKIDEAAVRVEAANELPYDR
jgi:hypothetical protein